MFELSLKIAQPHLLAAKNQINADIQRHDTKQHRISDREAGDEEKQNKSGHADDEHQRIDDFARKMSAFGVFVDPGGQAKKDEQHQDDGQEFQKADISAAEICGGHQPDERLHQESFKLLTSTAPRRGSGVSSHGIVMEEEGL